MAGGRKRKRGFGNQEQPSQMPSCSQAVSRYNRNPPTALDNNKVNICYMNSVLQSLYYIPEIMERLDFCSSTSIGNQQLLALKDIFNEMSSSTVVVTSLYFSMLKGDKAHWLLGQQQDACEFINDIIGNLYGKQNSTDSNLISNCPFSILNRTVLHCMNSNCTRYSSVDNRCGAVKIPMENSNSRISVQELIDRNKHSVENVDYNCEQCQATASIKTDSIISVSKYFIAQLGVFSFNIRGSKVKRPLELNNEIEVCNTVMELCGIVFHSGSSLNAGHYKSAVLVENNWYMTNDLEIVKWTPIFYYDVKSTMYPYFMIYKKKEDIDFNINILCSSALSNSSSNASSSNMVATYASVVSNNSTASLDDPQQKKHSFSDCMSFENLNKAIERDNEIESSDALKSAKQSVISELLYQTKKIEAVKESNLKRVMVNDKLSNFKNKKARKSITSAERVKNIDCKPLLKRKNRKYSLTEYIWLLFVLKPLLKRKNRKNWLTK